MLKARRTRGLALVLTAVALAALMALPGMPGELEKAAATVEQGFIAYLPGFSSTFHPAKDLGPLPAQTMTLGISLGVSNEQAMDSTITEMYTPGSALYGHRLTAAQFQAEYSPSPSQVQRVESYYEAQGLTVTPSADRLMLGLTGSSTDLGAAFQTHFEEYQLTDGRVVYGSATPAMFPSDLDITGVSGLTNAVEIEPADVLNGEAIPSGPASVGAGCNPTGGITPAVLEGQYGESNLLKTDNGTGVTVGIVDAYDSAEKQTTLASSLKTFASGCGLAVPKENFVYPVPGAGNSLNTSASSGWGGETLLDEETVDSMAPGATIDIVLATDSSFSVYEAVDFIAAHNLTDTISMSWGEPDLGTDYEPPQNPCLPYYSCNASWDGSYGFLHPVFAEAVAEGITPFGAAGDCGAYDGTAILTTDYPASDTFVTGVGGTEFNDSSATTYDGETGWSGTGYKCSANEGGGGGGFAPWPRPYWQVGPGVPTNSSGRGVPDVSADANDGTSQATPTWAGLVAVADQLHGDVGLGLIGPSMYAILRDGTEYASDFHDIKTGNNGYAAGTGWDPITGIGTPDAANLLPALARVQPVYGGGMFVTLNATSTGSLKETFTANVVGGTAPYSYDFVPGLYLGQWSSSKVLSYTYAAAGVYEAQVTVWDATGNSTTSLPLLLNLAGGSALQVTLTPSTTTPSLGQTVSFNTTVVGGTAPYHYTYVWSDGTYGYNATTWANHTYLSAGEFCPSVLVTDSATPQGSGVGWLTTNISTAGSSGGGGCSSAASISASASATPNVGDAPLAVTLTGTSSSPSATFAWVLGDGHTASGASVTHTYTTAGTYTARLWTNASGALTANASVRIVVNSAPAASYTFTPNGSIAGTTIHFSASATGGTSPFTWAWNFGDGTVSGASTASPTHSYTSAGNYTVTLFANDSGGGQAVVAHVVEVTAGPGTLTVTPSISALSGAAPLTVTVSGSITGGTSPYSVKISWGNGVDATSLGSSTTYTIAGTYTVSLWVNDSSAPTQHFSKSWTVTVSSAPSQLVVALSSNVTTGTVPFSVAFTAATSGGVGPYAWAWTFGDGQTASTTTDVADHTFTTPGSFTTTVTVTDSSSQSQVKSVTVTASAVTPLVLKAVVSPVPVTSGGTVSLAITVDQGGTAAAGADVVVTYLALGTAHEVSGSTDSTGAYDPSFAAPSVTADTNLVFWANATLGAASGTVTGNDTVVPASSGTTPASGPLGLSDLELGLLLLILVIIVVVVAVTSMRRRRPPTQSWSAGPPYGQEPYAGYGGVEAGPPTGGAPPG